jgi:5'-nucleotidase
VARFATLLAKRIGSIQPPVPPFLNINVPKIPLSEVKGIRITSLAHNSHVNTVEEGHDGNRAYYMLVRESVNQQPEKRSDIRATSQGYISITPLHLFLNNHVSPAILEKWTEGLIEEFLNTSVSYPPR